MPTILKRQESLIHQQLTWFLISKLSLAFPPNCMVWTLSRLFLICTFQRFRRTFVDCPTSFCLRTFFIARSVSFFNCLFGFIKLFLICTFQRFRWSLDDCPTSFCLRTFLIARSVSFFNWLFGLISKMFFSVLTR